ncbi:MAG: GAF domain-containing protein [Bacteroidales bacterium]
MKGLNATIKSRLISTAIVITIILGMLGIMTNYYLKSTFKQYAILSHVDNLFLEELELRKSEKNFLLKETTNINFYENRTSEILKHFYTTLDRVEDQINYLQENEKINELKLDYEVKLIERNFKNYRKNFEHLVDLVLIKGFKDYGLVGKMRNKIHTVETTVNNQNNLLYSKYMLTLRRHEKDYLLRKDLNYKNKFDKVIAEFKSQLSKDSNPNTRKQITSLLNDYQLIFHDVIKKDVEIGLSDDSGMMKKLNTDIDEIEKSLAFIHQAIYQNSEKKISKAVLTLFISIFSLSLLILIILYRDSRYIVQSINELRKYITRLGHGELPEKIKIKATDEIADMKKSINILTDNLKRTRDFVIEVGNGNFKKEVNVFNNKGDLGGNLIGMRSKLLQVAEERDQQMKDSEKRIWNNEGISLISDILRKNNDNIEELSYQIIKNLVKYLQANQGGIFIKNEISNENTYFNLTAAFAYDRRKFADKQIKLGDGLIGTCAIEGETIYMTDIPNHYMEITSGLGGANPNSLLIVPLKRENDVLGIIEIASFTPFEKYQINFMERIADNIASHLFFVKMNIKTNELLEKTQQQSEEMKAQEEEMRQNLEELTVTQERLANREEELLLEIENLNRKNKILYQDLIEIKSKEEIETPEYKNN